MMTTSVRLDGDGLDAFIHRLAAASPLHADVLAAHDVEAESIDVPDIFEGVTVFHVVVPVRRRPIEMLVADFGDEALVMGSLERVDELARRIDLHLQTPDQVVQYLRFWCRAALRHSEQLVETAIDFTWVGRVRNDPELRRQADTAARLARWIEVDSSTAGVYPAEITVLDQRTLHLRRLQVQVDGHVDELDRVELARDVPVVYVMP